MEKLPRIAAACAAGDISTLVQLATSPSGLVDDDARRRAWPLLLGCTTAQSPDSPGPWTELPAHSDEAQVQLDVDRSFVYYPKGEGHRQLEGRKRDLHTLITATLRRHPFLSYFQGYHDIVQVFLLVLGPRHASAAVERLSLLRIRDFMLPTLSAAVQHLALLPCILRAADVELGRHVSVAQPFFALAATLTLYAHEIEEYADIARLFDFLLATEASMSMYLFAVTILNRREELLQVELDEPEMMHAILSKLPKPLDLDRMLSQALDLFRSHPPASLPGNVWRKVDHRSVLKTTQDPKHLAAQSLDECTHLFHQQAASLRRHQALLNFRRGIWAYRRPAASITLAVAVAVLSWYFQQHGHGGFLTGLPLQLRGLWMR